MLFEVSFETGNILTTISKELDYCLDISDISYDPELDSLWILSDQSKR